MTNKTLIATALLACSSFSQAEWYFSPKVSVESMDYSTEWLAGGLVAKTAGVSIYNSSGWFFDFESLDGSDSNIEREETTITLGKSLGGGFSVFLGSKDTTTFGTDIDEDYWNFTASGFFGGISNNIKLASGNSFSVSVAAASLIGEVSLNGMYLVDDLGETEIEAFGLSVGGAWNTAITQSFAGSIGAKYQSYDYDGFDVEEIMSFYGKLSYRF